MRRMQLMKQIFSSLVAAALISVAPVALAAECYADYKAKQDNPLRLHYGVVALRGDCNKSAARSEIAGRIGRDGWKLLNVISVFDDAGLAGKKASAGKFYLRY